MRLRLIQTDPRPADVAGNIARALAAIGEAAGDDLAVLPEMFPRSYVDALEDEQAPIDWNAVAAQTAAAARAAGVAVAAGLPQRSAVDRWTNSLLIFDRHGKLAARYDKLHLFRFMNEHRRYAEGNQPPPIVEFGGLRVGFSICYDLRFPELYRDLRARGAQALVVVAQWPAERADHWHTLLRARAIENLCYTVGVNRCGTVGVGDAAMRFHGGSAVFSPWGDELWLARNEPIAATVELRADVVDSRRFAFRCWEDRRYDVAVLKPS